MCTSIVEIAPAEGMAKREDAWFPLTHAVVAYDHARHALLADVISLDFVNEGLPPGARAGVELTLESAKALAAALAAALVVSSNTARRCGAAPYRSEAGASTRSTKRAWRVTCARRLRVSAVN